MSATQLRQHVSHHRQRRVGSERVYRALMVLRGRRLVRRVQATTAPTALWGAVISIKEVPRHADIDGHDAAPQHDSRPARAVHTARHWVRHLWPTLCGFLTGLCLLLFLVTLKIVDLAAINTEIHVPVPAAGYCKSPSGPGVRSAPHASEAHP